ncbi:MAG: hypothetical protein GXP49_16610 [Deltaproteobacteria bacterium]|nr:hypothetical protein [Deltaproteobacteria bacterium]
MSKKMLSKLDEFKREDTTQDPKQFESLKNAGLHFLDEDRASGHDTSRLVIQGLEQLRSLGCGPATAYLEFVTKSLAAGSKTARAAAKAADRLGRFGDSAAQVAQGLRRLAELDAKHRTRGLMKFLGNLSNKEAAVTNKALETIAGLYTKNPESGEAACSVLAIAAGHDRKEIIEATIGILTHIRESEQGLAFDLALSLEQALAAIPGSLAEPFLAVLNTVAPSSAGSAEYLARKLPKVLSGLESDRGNRETPRAYLELVKRIVKNLGPASVAFCIKKLPSLATREAIDSNPKNIQNKIERVISVAKEHGRWAGLTLLLGKTKAAKRFMSK